MISKFISVLACVDKNIAFKFIGVALRLLNSQWKMHHCDVLCLVISFLCVLCKPIIMLNTFTFAH